MELVDDVRSGQSRQHVSMSYTSSIGAVKLSKNPSGSAHPSGYIYLWKHENGIKSVRKIIAYKSRSFGKTRRFVEMQDVDCGLPLIDTVCTSVNKASSGKSIDEFVTPIPEIELNPNGESGGNSRGEQIQSAQSCN